MKLKTFKERNNKRIGIIVFTIACILLITGVILYRTFAIFESNGEFNVINGTVQDTGDIEFAFYKDDAISKSAPTKEEGYSLDTSSSYCKDVLTGDQISNINWNDEKWGIELNNISNTKTKCYLYFKQIYKEEILNGAIPDLGNGRLVPVVISETEGPDIYVGDKGGKVKKADITNTSDPWYKYEDHKWANAVILKDGVTDHYKPNEEIPESAIESYFVWIPRYSYKLQDNESTFNTYSAVNAKGQQANVQSFYNSIDGGNKAKDNGFDIEFGTKEKGVSTTLLNKGESIVHPAFTSFDVNGMWVGKFETGYDGATSTGAAQQNTQDSTKVIIKPNVYSWRNIQVANAFYTSYEYLRELESHMMKNMEWGAVAYLTQSKYGLCDSSNKNCKEVRINNSQSYITGMAASFEPTCGYTETKESCNWYEATSLNMDGGQVQSYYNKKSVVASTTGNYSGIYDMAGGAWEYVMGVMQSAKDNANPASGRNSTYNSGFKGVFTCPTCDSLGESAAKELSDGKPWPSSKYYDLYDYNTSSQYYERGHLGDGTKEYGPFYSVSFPKTGGTGPTRQVSSYNADASDFVGSGSPWFLRGGGHSYGSDAGVGAFYGMNGHVNGTVSFRLVLMP